MTDASFIAAGWVGTAVAVAAYAVSVQRRLRRTRSIDTGTEVRSR